MKIYQVLSKDGENNFYQISDIKRLGEITIRTWNQISSLKPNLEFVRGNMSEEYVRGICPGNIPLTEKFCDIVGTSLVVNA